MDDFRTRHPHLNLFVDEKEAAALAEISDWIRQGQSLSAKGVDVGNDLMYSILDLTELVPLDDDADEVDGAAEYLCQISTRVDQMNKLIEKQHAIVDEIATCFHEYMNDEMDTRLRWFIAENRQNN